VAITPNNDFLKSSDDNNRLLNEPAKPKANAPIEKPVSQTKNPFGSGDVKNKNKSFKTKDELKKEKKYEQHFDLEKGMYPEYSDLSAYHRKCLPATNYWKIMNGEPEIKVPAWDTDYHKYFDKKCYAMAKDFQDAKKRKEDGRKVSDADRALFVSVQEDMVKITHLTPQSMTEEEKAEDVKATQIIYDIAHQTYEPKGDFMPRVPKPENNVEEEKFVTTSPVSDFEIEDEIKEVPVVKEEIKNEIKPNDGQLGLF